MALDPVKYGNKYKQEHYKRVNVLFKKEYFHDVLIPAVNGGSIGEFIREAVAEKIDRMTSKK